MIDMQIEHMEIDEKMSNEQTNKSSSDIFYCKIENYGVPTSIRLPSRS